MTYCCEHTRRASELMDSAVTWITGTSNHEMEPMIGVFMPVGGGTAAGFANKKACDEYKEWMSKARSKIYEAQQELRNCNCAQEKEGLKNENELLQGSVIQQVVRLAPNGRGEFEHRIEERNDHTGDYRNRIWTWRKNY